MELGTNTNTEVIDAQSKIESIKPMSEDTQKPQQTIKVDKSKKPRHVGIYIENVLTRKILIPFTSVGSNIKEIMSQILVSNLEGKCSPEGFIKSNSIKVINYSSGVIKSENVEFNVMFSCLLCTPVEGMKFIVEVSNITKAGLRCIYGNADTSPVDVFISRDISFENKYFNNLKVGDKVQVRVLGQRFEINDERISVICEIVRKVTPIKIVGKSKSILKK